MIAFGLGMGVLEGICERFRSRTCEHVMDTSIFGVECMSTRFCGVLLL